MRFIDREEVAHRLTCDVCIPIIRNAMIALSAGEPMQHLRTILPLSEGLLFGIVPGQWALMPRSALTHQRLPREFRQRHQGGKSAIGMAQAENDTSSQGDA